MRRQGMFAHTAYLRKKSAYYIRVNMKKLFRIFRHVSNNFLPHEQLCQGQLVAYMKAGVPSVNLIGLKRKMKSKMAAMRSGDIIMQIKLQQTKAPIVPTIMV
jgi:hypothetical protein